MEEEKRERDRQRVSRVDRFVGIHVIYGEKSEWSGKMSDSPPPDWYDPWNEEASLFCIVVSNDSRTQMRTRRGIEISHRLPQVPIPHSQLDSKIPNTRRGLTEKTKVSSASRPLHFHFHLLPSLSPFHLPTTTRARGETARVERLEEVGLPDKSPRG